MQSIIAYLLILCSITSLHHTANAQTQLFNSQQGVAANGYDVVAYFVQQQAIKGSDAFTAEWSGSKWRFASQAHLDSFILSPQKYAPQYGGYCAYGCSDRHLAPTEPNAWTIVANKLYLNYSLKVKGYWIKDTIQFINKADDYWHSLNKTTPQTHKN